MCVDLVFFEEIGTLFWGQVTGRVGILKSDKLSGMEGITGEMIWNGGEV